MILYVLKMPDGTLDVVKDDGRSAFAGSVRRFCDLIAARRLSTADAAAKTAARLDGSRRLVPLFLEATTILIPIRGARGPESLFLNAPAVAKIRQNRDGAGIVTFRDGTVLQTPSHAFLRRQMARAERIAIFLKTSGNW